MQTHNRQHGFTELNQQWYPIPPSQIGKKITHKQFKIIAPYLNHASQLACGQETKHYPAKEALHTWLDHLIVQNLKQYVHVTYVASTWKPPQYLLEVYLLDDTD